MKVSPPRFFETPLIAAPKRAYLVQWLVLIVALMLLGAQLTYDQHQTRQRIEAEIHDGPPTSFWSGALVGAKHRTAFYPTEVSP